VGYARLLLHGLDTVQECFDLQPSPFLVDLLDNAQAAARAVQENLEGVVSLQLGGEHFNAHATGARGGFRWRLGNDDFLLLIGSPRRDWTVSCRYLSAGLWEHGLEALRRRAFNCLRPYTVQRDWDCIRVTRADYCFDFFSPAFSAEFRPGLSRAVVCHSSAKVQERGDAAANYTIWGRGGRGETLTIGSKSALQVEIYDKTLEIDEASGKTWLYRLWVCAADGEWIWQTHKPDHVWRLECRWSGEFLKNRNVRRPHELAARIPELLAESLYMRRLGVPNDNDATRWRWPVHPIWSEAIRQCAAPQMLPVGRMVTGRRKELIERAEASLAGNLRNLSVLSAGSYDEHVVLPLLRRTLIAIERDPKHDDKERAAQNRYAYVDEAS